MAHQQDLQAVLQTLGARACIHALGRQRHGEGLYGVLTFIEAQGGGSVSQNLLEAVLEDTSHLLRIDSKGPMVLDESYVSAALERIVANLGLFVLRRYEDAPDHLESWGVHEH